MRKLFITLSIIVLSNISYAQQANRWQQRVNCYMEIDMNVETHKYQGIQKLTYFNNSPDTLKKVFYHLYFNAFQPNSMMDVRSRSLPDPDPRVGDRISKLKPSEIGYQKIKTLTQNSKAVKFIEEGTILEVELATPILPKSETVFEMTWEAQVPVQIRRSGRYSAEGIEYSMTQWYPKLAEYDYQGWHANPYVAREFHGVWGDFEVKITIDSSYVIGASGYLQNPTEIGHGYEEKGQKVKRPNSKKLTWHFKAPQVHDFAWAADPDYIHTKTKGENDVTLHFLYQKAQTEKDKEYVQNWEKLPEFTAKTLAFMNKNFGLYPYKQYSVIQGGDGGMEYPMLTLVTGKRSMGSLIGVMTHEFIHSWFQMVLATNESLYAWMDEGFNTYAGNLLNQHLTGKITPNPHKGIYQYYFGVIKSGIEEALSTHADHFNTNRAYGMAAYGKGALVLSQLNYIIGKKNTAEAMLKYYNAWKFRHPNPNDFFRIMEKQSGIELDWFKEYFVYTTHTIDYGIKSVEAIGKETEITLERIGRTPMPIDLVVTYKDGSKEMHYIPLRIMRGEKPHEAKEMPRILHLDWAWVNKSYTFILGRKAKDIAKVEIDPDEFMADTNKDNNTYLAEKE